MITAMTTADIVDYRNRIPSSGWTDSEREAALRDCVDAIASPSEAARTAAKLRIGAGLNRLNGRSAL